MAGPHITEEVIVDGLDLFDDDDTLRVGVEDPISATLGVTAYVESHVVDECKRMFGDGTWTDPEAFDRFYYDRALLIDIIDGVSADEEARIAEEKQVAFKRDWCAENHRHYFPLYMRAYEADPQAMRTEIFELLGAAPPAPRDPEEPASPTPMMLGGPLPEQPAEEHPTANVLDPVFQACIDGGGHFWPADHDPSTGAPTCTRCAFNPGWVAGGTAAQDEIEPPYDPAAPENRNPLEGVDLAAEGFEETETPLVLEDESGVTRPPEPTPPAAQQTSEQATEEAAAPKARTRRTSTPKRTGASKVQRPSAKK